MFKTLTLEECIEYTAWADENYVPFSSISGVWHPVVQQRCVTINKEKAAYSADTREDKNEIPKIKNAELSVLENTE